MTVALGVHSKGERERREKAGGGEVPEVERCLACEGGEGARRKRSPPVPRIAAEVPRRRKVDISKEIRV